ncbi:MAG: hypothetical protein HGA76_06005 [Candidatus Firestonebacteria bacterium]|nr:hypothetical protein [Candidatus Firestonebacteria bacterium]
MSFFFRGILSLSLLASLAAPAAAWDRRMGARPMGMGDAFAALADDANALNYNPAGLARLKNPSLALEYASLYAGLDDGRLQENHLALAYPLGPLGGVGLDWNNRALVDVYSENEMLLGYAVTPQTGFPWSAGISAKLFYWSYSDPGFLALSSSLGLAAEKYQYGLDVGVLGTLLAETPARPQINAALSVINVNRPDLGLAASNPLPVETRLGLAAQWRDWDGAWDAVWLNAKWQLHAGAEKWFNARVWGVRAGVITGEETGTTVTLGGGYRFTGPGVGARIVYAFNYPFGGLMETWGTHRLSLEIELPQNTGAPLPVKKAAVEKPSAPAVPAERMERIRTYVLEKIDAYFSALDTVERLQVQKPAPGVPALEEAARLLHEAAGSLILREDVVGFLNHLEAALALLQKNQPRP